MRNRFEGRTALLTGGAKGIGRATALRFLAEGGTLAVIDREAADSAFAENLRSAAGGNANRLTYLAADLTDEAAVSASVGEALAALGSVHILVNNVGFGANPNPIEETSRADWDEFMAINVTSAFMVTRAVLPEMRNGGWGRVVNLALVAGRSISEISHLHYSTAKAAIMGFTRKLAFEEGPNGILVNAVAPGAVFTERVRGRYEQLPPEEVERRFAAVPLKRAAEPEEIAAAILFLASDDASYITGAVLDVNGGRLMA